MLLLRIFLPPPALLPGFAAIQLRHSQYRATPTTYVSSRCYAADVTIRHSHTARGGAVQCHCHAVHEVSSPAIAIDTESRHNGYVTHMPDAGFAVTLMMLAVRTARHAPQNASPNTVAFVNIVSRCRQSPPTPRHAEGHGVDTAAEHGRPAAVE